MKDIKLKKSNVKEDKKKTPVQAPDKNKTGKTLIGKVISTKMQKTIVVRIEKKFPHPIYKKMLKRNKKIKADTNNFSLVNGDTVKIKEVRPISKDKKFMVIEKMEEKKK